jgi:1-acyl-sn-glycerol-3-phosphate acyltransferase
MSPGGAGQVQTIAKTLLKPICHFAWRVEVVGAEHVPTIGPAILAPNHTSVLDSFFVPLVLRRRITYVGKAEYLDDWKTRHLFPALGMIPLDRSGGNASAAALDTAASVLERGELFGIYPEGTRSRTGKLHKGHTGVARLALRTSSPIIPVGIVGSREVQPPDARYPKPFMHVSVRFGRPSDVCRYADRANDRLVLRQITDELMYEIRELSGQEYVDTYATKHHESLPAKATIITSSGPTDAELPELIEPITPIQTDGDDSRSSSSVLGSSRPLVDLTKL